MSDRREVDVVVVGAGPSGEVIAGRLAERDLAVALVEDRLVGGECSYWACMPSKALLRPAQALAEARRVPGAAEAVTGELDVHAALARRDDVIHHLDDGAQLPWLDERGVLLVRGHGHLAGERTVHVGDTELVARRAVVVAVGTAPMIPPVPGLAEAQPWTNREGTTTETLPGSLVVMGGGPVGVELAQAFATLGVEVTLLEREGRLLEREEAFAGEQVAEGLEAAGVRVLVDVQATGVRRGEDGRVAVETEGAGTLEADEILVASGRRQVTDTLGLESIGLDAGSPPKPIEVGDDLRVAGHEWLYVVGDANGRSLLTHEGKHQARIAADVICGRGGRIRGGLPPRVTFTEPQVAAVGHTLDSAQKAGLNVRAVDVDTQSTAGASFHGKGTDGTSRIVVDEDRRVIVGATFVGSEVAEWLHAATIAVVAEVSLDDLSHAVPAFPTRSEVWLKLLQAYGL
ncbi:MAG TPA: NAD(P)/FAD-dependent oxidoreductase [Baekduia sp.]|uniref:dihydrolipoyl dehydrogenase family protein n=1 Tax=Baekduia sp. TaxID=2600305 RepID=UPI002C927224|nr:NAD(P)/FAD-dependent oxidoreductase [Baekduia sp.]HMJ37039.1 NAD(P)/FAD-dependent oxidoreductase [Baekduia sp.]